MIFPVAGMDPSLTNWGIAQVQLDLATGIIVGEPELRVVKPSEVQGKQIRVNSNDLFKARQLADVAIEVAQKVKVIFIEVPVGSKSARAMASYGVCVGIVGALQSQGFEVIQVTADEVKKALTGKKTASKSEMIAKAVELYPNANWSSLYPGQREKMVAAAEHVADSIGAIHAGVQTPTFQNLLRLFAKVE